MQPYGAENGDGGHALGASSVPEPPGNYSLTVVVDVVDVEDVDVVEDLAVSFMPGILSQLWESAMALASLGSGGGGGQLLTMKTAPSGGSTKLIE